jgi:hypothetical protein
MSQQNLITVDVLLEAMKSSMRFDSGNGQLTIEDLTKKTIKQLEPIVLALRKQKEEVGEYSYTETRTAQQQTLELKFQIAEYILLSKIEAEKARKQKSEVLAQMAQLQQLLHEKKQAELSNLSAEELERQLEALKTQI